MSWACPPCPKQSSRRHAGIEVLAFALVSNAAAGVVGTPITHEEVLEAGRKAAPTLARLIERVVARLAEPNGAERSTLAP